MATSAPRPVNPSEVGWQFVPQYYTFVNKQPDRLHQFYTKKSTFIHGTEGDDGKPCLGQQEIHQRITSIGFQDCKVFIHSVDAQSSADGGIIIQVIGEMSNHADPWRKFVQTFFLAEQPNGYFVLNDIFRFPQGGDRRERRRDQRRRGERTGVERGARRDGCQRWSLPRASPPLLRLPSSSASRPRHPPPSKKPPPRPTSPSRRNRLRLSRLQPPPPPPPRRPSPTASIAPPRPLPPPRPPKNPPRPLPLRLPLLLPRRRHQPLRPRPPPAAAAAPAQPAAPAAPKTWANLAAANSKKWGSAVAQDSRGTTEVAPSPTPTPAPAATSAPARGGHQQSGSQHGAQGGHGQQQSGAQGQHPNMIAALNVTTPQCFVKGVIEPITVAALTAHLTTTFGPLKDLEIVRSKACAFFEFLSLDAARRAIAASLPNSQGGEGGVWVDCGEGVGTLRISIETRKERGDRPVSRPRGGAPLGEGRGGGGGGEGRGRGEGFRGGRGRGGARGAPGGGK
ncbi:hypothetical protein B0H14DRAFT_3081451 [Mycena olivaceomarginata]|nr:hypothetical protein B0H14DRAFT_3081451 [Mycena olivaceomarginata]